MSRLDYQTAARKDYLRKQPVVNQPLNDSNNKRVNGPVSVSAHNKLEARVRKLEAHFKELLSLLTETLAALDAKNNTKKIEG